MIVTCGNSLRVMVYASRDPLTGKKRWVSEFVKGTGRAARNKAKETEGRLLAQVEPGKHRATGATRMAQLLDEWLAWRESNGKPISPSTLYSDRGTIETKIKPGLGHVAVRTSMPACSTASTRPCARKDPRPCHSYEGWLNALVF